MGKPLPTQSDLDAITARLTTLEAAAPLDQTAIAVLKSDVAALTSRIGAVVQDLAATGVAVTSVKADLAFLDQTATELAERVAALTPPVVPPPTPAPAPVPTPTPTPAPVPTPVPPVVDTPPVLPPLPPLPDPVSNDLVLGSPEGTEGARLVDRQGRTWALGTVAGYNGGFPVSVDGVALPGALFETLLLWRSVVYGKSGRVYYPLAPTGAVGAWVADPRNPAPLPAPVTSTTGGQSPAPAGDVDLPPAEPTPFPFGVTTVDSSVTETRKLLPLDAWEDLGELGVPFWEGGFSYSRGYLTHRWVGDDLRLFMTGTESQQAQLFEMRVPLDSTGTPITSRTRTVNAQGERIVQARLQTVKVWGEFQRRLVAGIESVGAFPRGIYWDEDDQLLESNYLLWYGTDFGNPSHCRTRLKADGTVDIAGPYRGTFDDHNSTGGHLSRTPDWLRKKYGLGKLTVASMRYAQLTFMGACIHSYDPPALGTMDTPRDWSQALQDRFLGGGTWSPDQNTHVSFPMRRMAYNPAKYPLAIPGAQKALCLGGGKPIDHALAAAANTPPGDTPIPVPANWDGMDPSKGMGWNSEMVVACGMEDITTGAHIDTGTYHTFLSLALVQRKGHFWYGNYPRTSPDVQPPFGTCWHGYQAKYGGGIGPSCSDLESMVLQFDPEDLGRAAAGLLKPWEVKPYAFDRAEKLGDNPQWTDTDNPTKFDAAQGNFTFPSVVFDKRSNLLFIVQNGNEYANYNIVPTVRVFRLKAAYRA